MDAKAAPTDATSLSTIVESHIAIVKSESIARAVIQEIGSGRRSGVCARQDSTVRTVSRSISRLLGWSGPETGSGAMSHAVQSFERRLSAQRVGLTYIIKVTFNSSNSERAALILNTVAQAYVASQLDAKYSSSLRSEKSVKDRLNRLIISQLPRKHWRIIGGTGRISRTPQMLSVQTHLLGNRRRGRKGSFASWKPPRNPPQRLMTISSVCCAIWMRNNNRCRCWMRTCCPGRPLL